MPIGQTTHDVFLPYYSATASASGGKFVRVTFELYDAEEEGGLPGYTHDQIADTIRNALEGLTGVTGVTLDRRDEISTSL